MVITPAILTDDVSKFENIFKLYLDSGFSSVDIDIQESDFSSNSTLIWHSVLEIASSLTDKLTTVSVGWDLKVSQPQDIIEKIFETLSNIDCRFYVYSNANIDFINSSLPYYGDLGLGILGSVDMPNDDVYKKFNEVQIMTIRSETQGGILDDDLLLRTSLLREYGYTGIISIDGGVNLDSAKKIKHTPVERVSVGSFFQNSDNLAKSQLELVEALRV